MTVVIFLSASEETHVGATFKSVEGASVDIEITAPTDFRRRSKLFTLYYQESGKMPVDEVANMVDISSETRNLWIANLKPNTQYHFKLASSADSGEVIVGEETLFTLPYGEFYRPNLVDRMYTIIRFLDASNIFGKFS